MPLAFLNCATASPISFGVRQRNTPLSSFVFITVLPLKRVARKLSSAKTFNPTATRQWIAAKHMRRDLDASQRAAAALALLPLLEVEAKERQRLGQAKLPDPDSAGNAREKA